MVTVNLTGRLTRDPELRLVHSTGNEELEVCQLRVAARDRRGDTVYLDLAEWGPAGRAAAECLAKGSLIAFSGELRFRERSVDGGTNQYISAVGHIEFLNRRPPEENRDRLAGDSAPGTDDSEIPF